ncbi:MAG TPA: glycerophosphodiester phosphodiesterase family protein [Blastocatellia bacterium]|nr:glycerophosphodiester phosphodiesterase family protein [Blastocatellia bacterium]
MPENLLQNREPLADAPDRPLIIAHRGASGLAPENTLAAFRMAIELGADGVEMDVQLSSDGKPYVIHDLRVNRTTDGAGRVAALTSRQLGGLDAGGWFDRRLAARPGVRAKVARAALAKGSGPGFAGEPVPTLESALALLSGAGLSRVYIELKGSRGEGKAALLDQVIGLISDFGMERSATLLSFDHQIVKRARELAPELRTAATFPVARRALASTKAIISSVESVAASEAALHFGLVTRRVVKTLHERGFAVSAWTANNRIIMRRLISCGVDSIMTNFPHRLASVLGSSRGDGL